MTCEDTGSVVGGVCNSARVVRPNAKRAENLSFVYFIKSNDFIKIGRSIDFEKRLATFKTANPHGVELIGTVVGGYREETEIHRLLADFRESGEWFVDCDFVRKHIAQIVERGVHVEPSVVATRADGSLTKMEATALDCMQAIVDVESFVSAGDLRSYAEMVGLDYRLLRAFQYLKRTSSMDMGDYHSVLDRAWFAVNLAQAQLDEIKERVAAAHKVRDDMGAYVCRLDQVVQSTRDASASLATLQGLVAGDRL